jgi:hypothetical protein
VLVGVKLDGARLGVTLINKSPLMLRGDKHLDIGGPEQWRPGTKTRELWIRMSRKRTWIH